MTHAPHIALASLALCFIAFAPLGCKESGPYFVRGTARLPECAVAPAYDLDGTTWYDNGVVTIETTGCGTAMPSDKFPSCALDWVMSQEGDSVEIIVDSEYKILGRLCGTVLYLEGGWWLPVEDEGVCTYAEDSAEEVGIQAGGNALSVGPQMGSALLEAEGTLLVSGSCEAEYEVFLTQLF